MKLLATLALTSALVFGASAANASYFDRVNAELNTPEAKAEFLDSTCSSGDATSFVLCEDLVENGVFDSDARIAAVATGVVVGGAAGMVAASVPMFAGQTAIAQMGVTSILGAAPTVAVVGATGAAIGAAVGGLAATQ